MVLTVFIDHQGGQILKRIQGLSAFADDDAHAFAFDIHVHDTVFGKFGGDHSVDPHGLQRLGQEITGLFHYLIRVGRDLINLLLKNRFLRQRFHLLLVFHFPVRKVLRTAFMIAAASSLTVRGTAVPAVAVLIAVRISGFIQLCLADTLLDSIIDNDFFTVDGNCFQFDTRRSFDLCLRLDFFFCRFGCLDIGTSLNSLLSFFVRFAGCFFISRKLICCRLICRGLNYFLQRFGSGFCLRLFSLAFLDFGDRSFGFLTLGITGGLGRFLICFFLDRCLDGHGFSE